MPAGLPLPFLAIELIRFCGLQQQFVFGCQASRAKRILPALAGSAFRSNDQTIILDPQLDRVPQPALRDEGLASLTAQLLLLANRDREESDRFYRIEDSLGQVGISALRESMRATPPLLPSDWRCAVLLNHSRLTALAAEAIAFQNRTFLSALRKVEKRTTLRVEWTSDDGTSDRSPFKSAGKLPLPCSSEW